nr:immunoglobulin heavy chain junction region [Mus musculus]NSM03865.1 immunoglobulin heavy chain junction region [Mus musculus]NSM03895.1 immunoglobulin heavy chain junction region [Mus musculus]NSM03986.1 immunoglobulin heavy chain junction region [Mus musculus]NSM04008.1 immunoglobulin heavy chain junction region [Mus musculus]
CAKFYYGTLYWYFDVW